MDLLVPHECQRCGVVDEAQFTFSGPHIKQVCNSCGSYVKFYDKGKIPDVNEIKLKILAISTNIEYINSLKPAVGFVEGLTGLNQKIIYWRLYLKIREAHFKKEASV